MRVLARITQIDDVRTHPNADLLDLCMIGGWQVVSKRGEFKAGDYALYFEVDSWIPNAVAPFLSKGQPPKEYNGVLGERLRTVRLRGEVSQGLLLPIDSCPAAKAAFHKTRPVIPGVPDEIDVTALLGIQKYEAPIPACLAGKVRGNFPSVFPKTDEERIQNLTRKLPQLVTERYEVTEKLEGSSMSVAMIDGEFVVCSRNLNLSETADNSLWQQARRYKIEEKMRELALDNIAIQGEIVGNGVEGNHYGLTGHDFYVYSAYDIKAAKYVGPTERRELVAKLGLKHVPVVSECFIFDADTKVDAILALADGKSAIAPTKLREGLVFKSLDSQAHWKAVSNEYLLEHG